MWQCIIRFYVLCSNKYLNVSICSRYRLISYNQLIWILESEWFNLKRIEISNAIKHTSLFSFWNILEFIFCCRFINNFTSIRKLEILKCPKNTEKKLVRKKIPEESVKITHIKSVAELLVQISDWKWSSKYKNGKWC